MRPDGDLMMLVGVALMIALAGCPSAGPRTDAGAQGPTAMPRPPAPTTPASPEPQLSALAIELADGTRTTLGDYRGKPVLLDFWATFCKPCIEKLPHVQALQAKYGEEKLAVITVTLDPDIGTAVGWAKAHEMTLPIARFSDEMKAQFFPGEDLIVIPQTRLLDADGKLVKAWGPDGSVAELEQALAEMIGD